MQLAPVEVWTNVPVLKDIITNKFIV